MKNCLINFQDIDWEALAPGVQHKAYVEDNQRLRLVEFSDEFVEDSWCTKGHVGYILEGSISIDFGDFLLFSMKVPSVLTSHDYRCKEETFYFLLVELNMRPNQTYLTEIFQLSSLNDKQKYQTSSNSIKFQGKMR